MMVHGRILSPEVQAVELEYADHQNLRWPAGSGGFLLFRNEPVDWVRLNALGANDQVLEWINLAKKYPEKLGFGSPEECALAETGLMGMTATPGPALPGGR